MGRRSISVRRKLFFSAIVVMVTLLAAEGASRLVLRHTGFGSRVNAAPLFTVQDSFDLPQRPPPELRLRDDLWIRSADLPGSGSGSSKMIDAVPDGRLAVLVGGSAPHGSYLPYDETFWAILEREHVGGLTYLNAALEGYRVDGAVAQLHWALELGQVRVAAIYAGDNEWGGWTYPKVRQPNAAHRADDLLMGSAAYRIASTSLRYGLSRTVTEEVAELRLAEPLRLDGICLEAPYTGFEWFSVDQVQALRQRLIDNFADWLDLAVSTAAAMDGSTVLLMTNPIRYRLSPCHHIPQIVSERHAGTRLEERILRHLESGVAVLLEGDAEAAMPSLLQALEQDPESSLTNHYLGWAYEALGDYEQARRHFRVARNRTVGGAGMIVDLNDAVRRVAGDHPNAVLVDLEKTFDAAADRRGLGLGDELFLDWCHPSAEGNRLIAETLTPVILEAVGD